MFDIKRQNRTQICDLSKTSKSVLSFSQNQHRNEFIWCYAVHAQSTKLGFRHEGVLKIIFLRSFQISKFSDRGQNKIGRQKIGRAKKYIYVNRQILKNIFRFETLKNIL